MLKVPVLKTILNVFMIIFVGVSSNFQKVPAKPITYLIDKQREISDLMWSADSRILRYAVVVPGEVFPVSSSVYADAKTIFRGEWPDFGFQISLTSEEQQFFHVDIEAAVSISPNGRYAVYTSAVNRNYFIADRLARIVKDLDLVGSNIDNVLIWNGTSSSFTFFSVSLGILDRFYYNFQKNVLEIRFSSLARAEFAGDTWYMQTQFPAISRISDDGRYVIAMPFSEKQNKSVLAVVDGFQPSKSQILGDSFDANLKAITFSPLSAANVIFVDGTSLKQQNIASGQQTTIVTAIATQIDTAVFSFDGKWLAYTSLEDDVEQPFATLYLLNIESILHTTPIQQKPSPFITLTYACTLTDLKSIKWIISNKTSIDVPYVLSDIGQYTRIGGIAKANQATTVYSPNPLHSQDEYRLFVDGVFLSATKTIDRNCS